MLMSARNCPLGLTVDDVKEDVPLQNITSSNPLAAKKRYGFAQIAKKQEEKIAEAEQLAPQEEGGVIDEKFFVIKHGDFKFTECPVPMLTDSLMTEEDRFANLAVNIVNMCENTKSLPYLAGALDQTNVFYEARIIVLSEQNKIENEKQEEQEQKRKQEEAKNKSKGRRK